MSLRERESDQDHFSKTAGDAVTRPKPLAGAAKKILVIDDDPVTVKALTAVLRGSGYAVYSALEGSEAIRLAREEKPDMLLVDVNLPPDVGSPGTAPWDGFQVTRWLQHVSARKIPTIIFSATNRADYKKYAAMVGAEEFMTKPLNSALLLQSIQLALANPSSPMNGVAP
jgi:CheY-like chemotaxis protein